MRKELEKRKEELKEELTDEQYHVCLQGGTEQAFTGEYWDTKEEGEYHCVVCGNDLFGSETKYDSGTGWPSFWKPLHEGSVGYEEDRRLGMTRTEVVCGECGAHLGHVFDDGPPPTGKRYCVNSAALELVEEDE